MKSMAKAILVGGLILAAQAAMADGLTQAPLADGFRFPATGDDSYDVTPQSTYADQHAGDPVRRATAGFPASGDDSYDVTPQSTYADQHAGDSVRTAGRTFPYADYDDTGTRITIQSTYADSHLGTPAVASRPGEGADTGAN